MSQTKNIGLANVKQSKFHIRVIQKKIFVRVKENPEFHLGGQLC